MDWDVWVEESVVSGEVRGASQLLQAKQLLREKTIPRNIKFFTMTIIYTILLKTGLTLNYHSVKLLKT